MRVLYAVSAWPTQYMSMVPLAWAFQAAAHEVRVLCAASQVAPTTRAGLTPVPVLDGASIELHNRLHYVREVREGRWPYPWAPLHPVTGVPMCTLDDFNVAAYQRDLEPALAARAAAGVDAAVRYARHYDPGLIVHDAGSLEGPLLGRLLGVPSVAYAWGPVGADLDNRYGVAPRDISHSYERYGLEPPAPGDFPMLVEPCPPEVTGRADIGSQPVRYVPYNGTAAVPEWLAAPRRRPRVAVSWSTALTRISGPESYRLPSIMRALAALGVEVVVTATPEDVAALGTVPDRLRVLEQFPLSLLLPSCDAVVHHGGAGSTMTAAVAGVPQLAVTFASEQAFNAERIAACGAGRHLPGHLCDEDRIGAMVTELLGPDLGSAAEALRDRLTDRPAPAELAESLLARAGVPIG